MADGICTLERSVRTVGCFTDDHGRDAVAARFSAATVALAALPLILSHRRAPAPQSPRKCRQPQEARAAYTAGPAASPGPV
jgi:hypothetical protein